MSHLFDGHHVSILSTVGNVGQAVYGGGLSWHCPFGEQFGSAWCCSHAHPLTQQERGGEIYTRTQGTWEAGHTTGLCENTEVKMS